MGHFQWYHRYGNATFKDNGCSLRIDIHIELSCRGDVSETDGSTHHRYCSDVLLDIGEGPKENGEVGHGTRHHKLDLFLFGSDFVVDVEEGLFSDGLFRRPFQLCPLKPCNSMKILSSLQFATERSFSPPNDLYIISTNLIEYIKGIPRGVVNGGVASRGRNANKSNLRGKSGHDDCQHVILTGIAI